MRTLARVARWFAVAWAIGAYVYLVGAPFYGSVHANTAGMARQSSATLLDVNGGRVLVILAVPVVATLLAVLPVAPRSRRWLTVIAATVTLLFALLGSMTIGLFYLPAAVALMVAAAEPRERSPAAT